MVERNQRWLDLIAVYRRARIEYPSLKPISLAQWAHESDFGTSGLAQKHRNFAGMNYRPRMRWRAMPVSVATSDGEGTYCHFFTLGGFIRGYWRFLANRRYEGWQDFAHDPQGFISHLAAHGYAADKDYLKRVNGTFAMLQDEVPDFETYGQ